MMKTIEINKGVKVEKHEASSKNKKYDFPEMEIGDWFSVQIDDDRRKYNSLRQLAYHHGRKRKRKYTTAILNGILTVERIK